jgi:hypothetical protein
MINGLKIMKIIRLRRRQRLRLRLRQVKGLRNKYVYCKSIHELIITPPFNAGKM